LITRVIVATLGERATLKETLNSIAKQNIIEMEVKIVCPHSSLLKVQKIAEECLMSNFELIRDSGKGLSAAINQGFKVPGNFEYFCWINDDDELTMKSLERARNFLETNRKFNAVIGTLQYSRKNKHRILRNRVTKLNLIISKVGPNVITQPGSLIRRTAIHEEQLLNEKYKYAMDLDMWLRIMRYGKIGIIKEIQAIMKWHKDSITIGNRKSASIEAFQIRLSNSETLMKKLLVIICYLPTRLMSSLFSKIH
jgi:GT2 family glycosyltransferase